MTTDPATAERHASEVLSAIPDWIWSGAPPVPVEDIADSCFGLLVRDIDNLADAVGAPALQAGQTLSGLLLPARREILVNAGEARTWPPRRRFTICHELGHWVMHRTGREPLFCRAVGTEPQPDIRPPRPPHEVAADAFAAALLMPDELVVEAFERGPARPVRAVRRVAGGDDEAPSIAWPDGAVVRSRTRRLLGCLGPAIVAARMEHHLATVARALARDVDGGALPQGWIDHLIEALEAAQENGLHLSPDAASASAGTPGRARRWVSQRIALGSTVTAPEREGLPELHVPLKELTPLEILAYWHPKPQVRLVANRLARKLDLNITEVCNYDCFYCYQRSRDDDWETKATKAADRELSIDEWVAIVREAHALGVGRVKITGGEPLTKRGVTRLIEACVAMPGLEEIELCTNASLLDRHAERIASAIGSARARFHVHTSIDGIDDGPRSRTLTKASRDHLDRLERLMATSLRDVRVSVNSMWNRELTDQEQLAELHRFMARGNVERWTISYPYFVRDFIASSVADGDAMPSYSAIVDAAARLVELHRAAGTPFHLSIPLLVKHELVDDGYAVSSGDPASHPCFPCHGSYFVIGPEGHVFDCLLLNRSAANVRTHVSLWGAGLAAGVDNPFYRLTTHDVAQDCVGCRYSDLCHGQCANDRANTHPKLDGETFGRDRSACSMLPLAEARIWRRGSEELQRAIASRLDPDGFIPARWDSPHAIATFAPPDAPDRRPDQTDLALIPDALVRRVSTVSHDPAASAFGAVEREPEPRRPSARAIFHQALPDRLRSNSDSASRST